MGSAARERYLMPRSRPTNPLSWLADRVTDYAVSLLTKPLSRYTLTFPNDMAALKRHIEANA